MKVKIVRTYDMGTYERAIEKCYENYEVDHVDTHTTMQFVHNREIVYFIAIIFYKEKEHID